MFFNIFCDFLAERTRLGEQRARHSPPEHRLVLAAPTTGCKGLIANSPRLKPGVIDTAPSPGRTPSLNLSRISFPGAHSFAEMFYELY